MNSHGRTMFNSLKLSELCFYHQSLKIICAGNQMEVPESIQPSELRSIILKATKPECQDRPSLKALRYALQRAFRFIPEVELRKAELELPSLQLVLDNSALPTRQSMPSACPARSFNFDALPTSCNEHPNVSTLGEVSSVLAHQQQDSPLTSDGDGSLPGSHALPCALSEDEVHSQAGTFDSLRTVGSVLHPPGIDATEVDKLNFLHQQLDSFGTNKPIHGSLLSLGMGSQSRLEGGALSVSERHCSACVNLSVT